ncbi:MAG: hypothetical protein IPG58_07955 [Acidobacteria bacterium]|nr:hypothetical protein [Acidobacteriota bacterium]
MERTKEQLGRYDLVDDVGNYEWVNFRKHGAGSNRDERRRMYYPIFAAEDGSIRVPKMVWSDENKEWNLLERPQDNESLLYPKNEQGEEKAWNWGHLRVRNNLGEFCVRTDRTRGLGVYVKSRMNSGGMLPLTWFDKRIFCDGIRHQPPY